MGQDIGIIQEGYLPEISVSPTVIDFGDTNPPSPKQVTVTSNSKWVYSKGADWDNIIASSSPAATTISGSHTYSTTTQNTVTFTPGTTVTPSPGIPAAGEPLTTTAVFTTTDNNPAVADSKTVTINSITPLFFELISTDAILPTWERSTFNVQANTNAYWRVISSEGTGSLIENATPWGLKSATILLPENTIWSNDSSPEFRNITINTLYGPNSSLGSSGDSFILKKPGKYIGEYSHNMTSLNWDSDTNVSVNVTGSFAEDEIEVYAYDVTNSKKIASKTIPAKQVASQGTVELTVPGNDTWFQRTVNIRLTHPYDNRAVNIGSAAIQISDYSLAYSSTNMPTLIPGETNTYNLTFVGKTTPFQVRAMIDGKQFSTSSNNSNLSKGIIMYENKTSSSRAISFEYNHPVNGWTYLFDRVQRLPLPTFTQISGPTGWANRGSVTNLIGAVYEVSGTWEQPLYVYTCIRSAGYGSEYIAKAVTTIPVNTSGSTYRLTITSQNTFQDNTADTVGISTHLILHTRSDLDGQLMGIMATGPTKILLDWRLSSDSKA